MSLAVGRQLNALATGLPVVGSGGDWLAPAGGPVTRGGPGRVPASPPPPGEPRTLAARRAALSARARGELPPACCGVVVCGERARWEARAPAGGAWSPAGGPTRMGLRGNPPLQDTGCAGGGE